MRLLRSHACGVGEPYPPEVVRAAMLLRANTLAKGYSGARPEVVALLVECLARGLLPHVPSRGSVGASGDLAPLAHLALPLIGEGEAWVDGERLPGSGGARARSASSRSACARRRGSRSSTGRSSWRRWRRSGSCAPSGWRGAADIACAISLEALQGSRTSFLPADPGAAAVPGAGRVGGERAPAARGLGDQRGAPLVRQGAGRLLAALRAAGARRLARPARLRARDGRGRAQRRDRQPARARRGRAARLERQLPRPAARVRARRARDGGRRAREHLRAPRRAARQPEPVRRAAGVPDPGRRPQLRAS